MKRANPILFVALGALALAACSTDNPPPPSSETTTLDTPGRVQREDVVRISAVVEKIDHATRMVTLKGSDGKTVTFRASDDVRNLDQVEKGDQVDAAFYRSVAINLRKPGETSPSVSSAGIAQRAAVGEQPGAAGAQSVTVVATIRALDPVNQTATLEGPEGDVTTIAVRNPQHFDVARVGDLVEITYTEAVAISVDER